MLEFLSKRVNPLAVIKFVKWLRILSIALVCAFMAYFGYQEYLLYENHNKPLNFRTDEPWAWHGTETQIKYDKNLNRSVLRKISQFDTYILYAHKNEDYSYNFKVLFLTSCVPDTIIKTRQKSPDGDYKELKCNTSGDGLFYEFQISAHESRIIRPDGEDFYMVGSTLYSVEGDLDGFKFKEDVSNWDFRTLDQEITLLKASAPQKSN